MKILMTIIAGVMLSSGSALFAHAGHKLPGAIPPPPNGGKVEEAETVGGNGKAELFFEVTYKKGTVTIYPQTITDANPSVFTPVSAKELTEVSVSTEIPRKKKKHPLKVKNDGKILVAAFNAKRANRFFVHVAATYKNEKKFAKIQVEKRR